MYVPGAGTGSYLEFSIFVNTAPFPKVPTLGSHHRVCITELILLTFDVNVLENSC
jgi:hypothetical protein